MRLNAFALRLQSPYGWITCRFNLILYVIGQVMEEVDACLFLQFVNADGVFRYIGIRVGLVLHPESDGLVATLAGALVLAKQGHEEILGREEVAS